MMIRGKGYYIWKVEKCYGGNINNIVLAAVAAGIKHVYIKIADGATGYNGDVRALVAALQAVGIEVWGWQYVYGFNPQAEARMAARRIRESGVTGFIVDAEGEFKVPEGAQLARAYMFTLRAEVGAEFPLALSSYRYPTLHRQFPFETFLEFCDLNFPQVYWLLAHDPARQLERCVNEYNALSIVRPMVPTGAAWRQGSWQPTTNDIHDFLAAAEEQGLAGASFWSWQHAEQIPQLWMAIHEYDWPVDPEPEPEPEPEIPEDEMGEVLDTLRLILAKQDEILTLLQGGAEPEPPEEPEPPAPPPATKYYVQVTAPDRTNARFVYGVNAKGKPIFQIYPGDSSKASERVQYKTGVTLEVIPEKIDGDSDIDCYLLVGRFAGNEQLYIWTKECMKLW